MDSGCPLRWMRAWRQGPECADGASCNRGQEGEQRRRMQPRHGGAAQPLLFSSERSEARAPPRIKLTLEILTGFNHADELRCRFSDQTLQLPAAPNCCRCFAGCSLAALDWPANWPEVNRAAPIKNTDELTAAFQATWTSTAAPQCHS